MSEHHAFRLQTHDYNEGIYFVTICSFRKRHIFGTIINGEMTLSTLGKIVQECIDMIPMHHAAIVVNSVVMPNHVHLVLNVENTHDVTNVSTNDKAVNYGCLKPSITGVVCEDNHHNSKLAVTVGGFKSSVTRMYRKITCQNDFQVWQRLFHEHWIRNQRAFDNIMTYVDNNVRKWSEDCFH